MGSWGAGRWVGSWTRRTGLSALAFYALVEVVIGVGAFVVPPLFRAGETKVINFLMGKVMRKTQGKADPAAVREILTRELRK